ncbi:MAG: hypothetical protein ACLP5H_24815 [Desulfomonilaceae bacterium]
MNSIRVKAPGMPSAHKIKGRDLLLDIRSGMTDAQLMDKYEMSFQALHDAFEQLLQAKVISRRELRSRLVAAGGTTPSDATRRLPRHYPVCQIPIYDAKDPAKRGIVRDLTPVGLGIIGIKAKLDEVRTFLIAPGGMISEGNIVLDAKCRWVKKEDRGRYLTGFQVTEITRENSENLRRLIEELTFGD